MFWADHSCSQAWRERTIVSKPRCKDSSAIGAGQGHKVAYRQDQVVDRQPVSDAWDCPQDGRN